MFLHDVRVSIKKHWLGIKELFPDHFNEVCQDEKILGFTLDSKKTLEQYVYGAQSCLVLDDTKAVEQLKTGVFNPEDVFVHEGQWRFPAGAFGGSDGGPC